MIRLRCCVLKRRQDIFRFKVRIILQNFAEGRAGPEEFENVRHAYTHPPNTRATATLSVVNCDATEPFR